MMRPLPFVAVAALLAWSPLGYCNQASDAHEIPAVSRPAGSRPVADRKRELIPEFKPNTELKGLFQLRRDEMKPMYVSGRQAISAEQKKVQDLSTRFDEAKDFFSKTPQNSEKEKIRAEFQKFRTSLIEEGMELPLTDCWKGTTKNGATTFERMPFGMIAYASKVGHGGNKVGMLIFNDQAKLKIAASNEKEMAKITLASFEKIKEDHATLQIKHGKDTLLFEDQFNSKVDGQAAHTEREIEFRQDAKGLFFRMVETSKSGTPPKDVLKNEYFCE